MEINMSSPDNIKVIPIPALKDNYIWALLDQHANHALIVDPGEAEPVLAWLKQQRAGLAGILITHHHWDHTAGAAALKQAYRAPVLGPEADHISELTAYVHEKDQARVNGFPLAFQIMDIPGHTLGHIAYYTENMLFCGDTLFAAGCGRIFEGTPAQMYASLQKIAALPETTMIYCAHEYTLNNLRFAEQVEPGNPKIAQRLKEVSALRNNHQPTLPSLLRDEKATNPFLRCDSEEVRETVSRHTGKLLKNNIEIFAALRAWKDNF